MDTNTKIDTKIIEYMNRPIISKNIELVIKINPTQRKVQDHMVSFVNSTNHFKN